MNVLELVASRKTLPGKLLAVLRREWPRPVAQSWLVSLVQYEFKFASRQVYTTLRILRKRGEVKEVAGRKPTETYWSLAEEPDR